LKKAYLSLCVYFEVLGVNIRQFQERILCVIKNIVSISLTQKPCIQRNIFYIVDFVSPQGPGPRAHSRAQLRFSPPKILGPEADFVSPPGSQYLEPCVSLEKKYP